MPRYLKDVNRNWEADDIQRMLDREWSAEHKAAIVVLYLSGARPSEVLPLKRSDFEFSGDDVRISFRTLKGGLPRTLVFDRWATPFIPFLSAFVAGLKGDDLFRFKNDSTLRKIVYHASEGLATPYSFRHNRLYKLAREGADVFELADIKGSKSIESVRPYVVRAGQASDKFKRSIK